MIHHQNMDEQWLKKIPLPIGAYLTGFADGEGSFNVSLRKKDYSVGWQACPSFKIIGFINPLSPIPYNVTFAGLFNPEIVGLTKTKLSLIWKSLLKLKPEPVTPFKNTILPKLLFSTVVEIFVKL